MPRAPPPASHCWLAGLRFGARAGSRGGGGAHLPVGALQADRAGVAAGAAPCQQVKRPAAKGRRASWPALSACPPARLPAAAADAHHVLPFDGVPGSSPQPHPPPFLFNRLPPRLVSLQPSDQVFRSGVSPGVPNWVPSELATGEHRFAPGNTLQGSSHAGAGSGGCMGLSAAAAPSACFWFAVAAPPPAAQPAAAARAPANPGSELQDQGAPSVGGSGSQAYEPAGACTAPTSGRFATPRLGHDAAAAGGSSCQQGMPTYGRRVLPAELAGHLLMGPLIGSGSFGRGERVRGQGRAAGVGGMAGLAHACARHARCPAACIVWAAVCNLCKRVAVLPVPPAQCTEASGAASRWR